jgi:hypothetical protein
MHIRKHAPRYQQTTDGHPEDTDAYVVSCTCGQWSHRRPVNPGNPLDRAEAEEAWFEHANPGVRL